MKENDYNREQVKRDREDAYGDGRRPSLAVVHAAAWPPRNAGFNLVEIALAVFVLSLGLLAIFGLFPAGLGMADTARRETQAAMFADHVFGAMRSQAMATEESWVGDVTLLQDTVSFYDYFINLRNAADVALPSPQQLVGHTAGEAQLVRYPFHDEGDAVRHSTYLRYALDVGLANNDTIGTAELIVWTGRSGVESNVFYTQFYPYRKIVQ